MSGITIALLLIYAVVFGGGSVLLILQSMRKKKSPAGGDQKTVKNQDGFGSRLGLILSTDGLAGGVGAMWRFPMMCAQWGGGAFVLAFVVICIVIVIPAGWAEISFGRKFKKGPVGALNAVAGKTGKGLGYIMGGTSLGLFAYYPAIMAIILCYIFKSFGGIDYAQNAQAVYDATNDNRPVIYILVVAVILLVAFVSLRGIQKGIEKICKILLPLLFLILIAITIRICLIPGIAEGIEFYIRPDWAQLANPQMWAAAAGMALFAVGLGPACLLAYGRYVDDDMDIATDFITVNVVQLTICLISGFVVIPAVVAFGLDPFIGKGLLFVSLPTVFATIPGGSIFLILFFIALMFAGISSSLNQVEIPVQALMDEEGFGMSRKKAVLTCVVIAVLIAIPCVWNDAFFAVFDNVIGNIMYTFDAAALAIVLAWKVGAKTVREEWYLPTSAVKWGRPIDYMYKYVAVICLVYFTITAVISLF